MIVNWQLLLIGAKDVNETIIRYTKTLNSILLSISNPTKGLHPTVISIN